MQTIDTQFDVLLYIYNEMTSDQKEAMESRMTWDFDLKEEVDNMMAVKTQLEKCNPLMSPSQSLLDSLIQRIQA